MPASIWFQVCLLFLVAGSALVGRPMDALARQSLRGDLEPGPHAPGMRTLLLHDRSRPALPTEDGRAVATGRHRQMQIVMWFPARPGTGQTMRYGDVIATLAQELDFSPIDAARRAHALSTFSARAAGHGGDSAALHAALPRLADMEIDARANAMPAAGRFPLVLVSGTPALFSILAGYLASHGIVVAAIAPHGVEDEMVEYWSTRGLEAMADDVRFMLTAIDTMPFVDDTRIAALGLGIGASGALAFQMRTRALSAFVSLEGGVTTEGEISLLRRSPWFDIAAVDIPILAITAPHPAVDAARLDMYRYAQRHLVHFPAMGEFWFLDYGMLEPIVPSIIGAAPGDTRAGFAWGARHVLRFLQATLRNDRDAAGWLSSTDPPADAPAGLFTRALRDALAAPPVLAVLKQTLLRDGVAGVRALIAGRTGDPAPIPEASFTALSTWLSEGRDADGRMRRELAELRVGMHPGSARARVAAGIAARGAGDVESARAHLTEALRLLLEDPDPQLDFATRERLRDQVRALLTGGGGDRP